MPPISPATLNIVLLLEKAKVSASPNASKLNAVVKEEYPSVRYPDALFVNVSLSIVKSNE